MTPFVQSIAAMQGSTGLEDHKINDALASQINAFWEKRGMAANARTERRYIRDAFGVEHRVWVLRSDMVNGQARAKVVA